MLHKQVVDFKDFLGESFSSVLFYMRKVFSILKSSQVNNLLIYEGSYDSRGSEDRRSGVFQFAI